MTLGFAFWGLTMRARFGLMFAVIWSAFTTTVAAEPLQPTTNWAVDYGETRCAAVRSFNTSADPISFGIIPSINGKTYKLVVNVQRKGPTFAEENNGTIDFGHGKIRSWLLHYGRKGLTQSNYEFHLSAKEIEQARSSTSVRLGAGDTGQYEFALSEMPALLDALAKCTADLQQYWNYSQGAPVPLAQLAKGDLRAIFSSEDYPSEALFRSQGGTAQYQLLIDEKGAVAGCDLIVQSGVPAIDAVGCQVITERAKFSPAIDTHGKGVRSVVTTPPIVWMTGPNGFF